VKKHGPPGAQKKKSFVPRSLSKGEELGVRVNKKEKVWPETLLIRGLSVGGKKKKIGSTVVKKRPKGNRKSKMKVTPFPRFKGERGDRKSQPTRGHSLMGGMGDGFYEMGNNGKKG